MTTRWIRLLRHRWHDERTAARVLRGGAMARLAERVRESERRHTGEIRLCIEAGLPLSYLWRDATPRERAIALFGKLGVWDTEANNGVLVYLLLADHAIEIVADRGLARRVPQAHWDAVVAELVASLREGAHEDGLGRALDAVGAQLIAHFPADPHAPNPNELPDHPVLR